MAENLERKQQGEQFKILDPARLPEKPIKPDRNKILLMGAVIGLAHGIGVGLVPRISGSIFSYGLGGGRLFGNSRYSHYSESEEEKSSLTAKARGVSEREMENHEKLDFGKNGVSSDDLN